MKTFFLFAIVLSSIYAYSLKANAVEDFCSLDPSSPECSDTPKPCPAPSPGATPRPPVTGTDKGCNGTLMD